jgi:hypothetical protein
MKTEKKQTAVEWYAEEAMRLEIKKTKGNISVYQMINELSNVLNQAKEMENERLKEAYSMGRTNKSIKEFNETFKQQEQ